MIDVRREVWLPDFAFEYREITGRPWPIVIVTKFERNELGERRFVSTRTVDINLPVEGEEPR